MTTTTKPLAIYAAMSAVMADVGAITKNRSNQQQGFKFRGIDDVMNALHGPLTKHGVLVVPEVIERLAETRPTGNNKSMNVVHLHVRFTFYAADGSSATASAWGEAQDSGDKATGKAHSMAYKTAFLEVFCVPTEDLEDADATSQDAAPEPRQAPGNGQAVPAGWASWEEHNAYVGAMRDRVRALPGNLKSAARVAFLEETGGRDPSQAASWNLPRVVAEALATRVGGLLDPEE